MNLVGQIDGMVSLNTYYYLELENMSVSNPRFELASADYVLGARRKVGIICSSMTTCLPVRFYCHWMLSTHKSINHE